MKLIFYIFLSSIAYTGLSAHEKISNQDYQQAINTVAELSEQIANLIIHHKKNMNNSELTKKYSIDIIKKITEIIAICIHKAKTRKNTKTIDLHDEATIQAIMEQITLNMIETVEKTPNP